MEPDSRRPLPEDRVGEVRMEHGVTLNHSCSECVFIPSEMCLVGVDEVFSLFFISRVCEGFNVVFLFPLVQLSLLSIFHPLRSIEIWSRFSD